MNTQRKKRIVFMTALALAAANVTTFFATLFTTSDAYAAAPRNGRQGSINGVATCHCPDDLGNCYCNY